MMRRAAGRATLGLTALLVLGFVAGEVAGWRWLAGPAERWLSSRLERPVHISRDQPSAFRLRLWRGVRLEAARLQVDAPAWSGAAALFEADQVLVVVQWRELLAWRRGEPLPLRLVRAQRLRAHLLRRADGVGNWQAASTAGPPSATAGGWPVRVGMIVANDGQVRYVDVPNQADIQVQMALTDGRLLASASGHHRKLPVRGWLRSGRLNPLLDGEDSPIPTSLELRVGRAQLRLDGAVQHPLRQPAWLGRYTLTGPSLAAVGEPLGLTLPTTAAFEMAGRLAGDGVLWNTVVDRASIGRSLMDGAFQYDTRRAPLTRLAGRLHASMLALADLGPAIGTPTADEPRQVRSAGRVLPDRAFDLPSLRAMDADVVLQFNRLDFGTSALQSAAPLAGHLTLRGGVLRLDDLDARLAQGRVRGRIELDGRADVARWQAALDGRGLRLEQWVRALRRPGQMPYASGLLAADVRLVGEGRSIADLLAGADGRVSVHWSRGQLSHLVVEAAGLDIAQGLGLLARGDDPLQVSCGMADLRLRSGRLTPDAFVIDTRDSRLWLDGSVSLADERLALVVRVQPKDFSPLTLRAPVHIRGTLAQPSLALDKAALAQRAIPAALLAMVHPLAALIPLIDGGEPGPTQDCRDLLSSLRGDTANRASTSSAVATRR